MQLKMTWPSALQIICIVWVFLLVIHVSVQSSVVQAFETHCLKQIVLLYCNYISTSYMQVSRLSLQRRAVQITFLYCTPVVSICGPIQIPVDILKPVQAVERGVDKYTSLPLSQPENCRQETSTISIIFHLSASNWCSFLRVLPYVLDSQRLYIYSQFQFSPPA